MLDEITYPFANFNGCTVEVWEWTSNFTIHIRRHVITSPCSSMLSYVLVSLCYQPFTQTRSLRLFQQCRWIIKLLIFRHITLLLNTRISIFHPTPSCMRWDILQFAQLMKTYFHWIIRAHKSWVSPYRMYSHTKYSKCVTVLICVNLHLCVSYPPELSIYFMRPTVLVWIISYF